MFYQERSAGSSATAPGSITSTTHPSSTCWRSCCHGSLTVARNHRCEADRQQEWIDEHGSSRESNEHREAKSADHDVAVLWGTRFLEPRGWAQRRFCAGPGVDCGPAAQWIRLRAAFHFRESQAGDLRLRSPVRPPWGHVVPLSLPGQRQGKAAPLYRGGSGPDLPPFVVRCIVALLSRHAFAMAI